MCMAFFTPITQIKMYDLCITYDIVYKTQETEVIVSQVLDELGISLDHELSEITPGLEKPHIQQAGGVSG